MIIHFSATGVKRQSTRLALLSDWLGNAENSLLYLRIEQLQVELMDRQPLDRRWGS
jgi:hypothetical protein